MMIYCQDKKGTMYFDVALTEKAIVTPAKAGVQNVKEKKINNTLDSGLRRNDDSM